MAKTKNIIILWILICSTIIGDVLWAKVEFEPLYSDIRFQPDDKLHTDCTNSADILFSPQGQKISTFKIILSYNPETLEILRILPNTDHGIATSKIEYNKIILQVNNPTFTSSNKATSFFQIYFKSTLVGKDTITIAPWSEATNTNKTYPLSWVFDLEFVKVPECEPDIIPPSINLIYPKNSEETISLDQYYIFDIKDIGKGIDKNSAIISFNGDQYFYWSESMKWNGNYLTFYPSRRIPINKNIDLTISITDKQSYGWANKTQSIYNFHSATGIVLQNNINPMIFRKIAQEAEKISASVDECWLLGDLYSKSTIVYQKELQSIIKKLGCNLASLDTSVLEANKEMSDTSNQEQKQYRNISVFASLWWILFFITFTLKIHYILAYRKHKKTHLW